MKIDLLMKKLVNVAIMGAVLLGSSSLSAASIKALSKAKSLVQIDEGSDSGLKKGTEVCFGDKKTKTNPCGTVTGLKKNTAVVKLSNESDFGKLKKGMQANYEASSVKIADEGATNSGPLAGAHRRNIELMQITTLMHAFTANKLGYSAPPAAASGTTSSLWNATGTPDYSIIGFGLKGEFPIGKKFSVSVGGRMAMIRGFSSIDSYYNTGTTAVSPEYVETSQTFSSMGLWSDFFFLDLALGSKFILRAGAGLDLDMSTVAFSATQKDERAAQATQGEFAKAESSLKTVSLRIPLAAHLFLKPIGLSLSPVVAVPLMASASSTASSTDTNSSRLNGANAADDLKTSLGHKKNSFAFMLQAGAYWAF